jgi:hypothetical protein
VNLLQFYQSDVVFTSIDSQIRKLYIQHGYNYRVDERLVHPIVFERLTELNIKNTIASIQTDLFMHLQNLSIIDLTLDRMGTFFHQVGIGWMANVGLQSSVTVTIMTIYQDSPIYYEFPDHDFCIFAPLLNYTQQNQVTFYDPVPSCTLTFTWLQSLNWFTAHPCDFSNINGTRIEMMLKQCELTGNTTTVANQIYWDYYQTRILNMLFIELVPFVFIPCACLIGLFFNWKIIQTLKNNEKKELKEDFYKYMSANAKFNCLYCLIFVFYPITSCNWNASYYFCSEIYTYKFVQYFKIVMMAYFGEVVKMCANIAYLMMSLNRYLLVGKKHYEWLVKIAKLEFKWVIRGSLVFSALINIGHGWQYQAIDTLILAQSYTYNVNYHQTTYYDTDTTTAHNGYSYSDYPLANQNWGYFYFSAVYFVINFCVFFILNTGIEIKIVRRMHKELQEKRERFAKTNVTNLSSSATSERSKTSEGENDDKKREEEDRKRERRVIMMVVFNSILNIILRAPDMLCWMENYQIWQDLFTDKNSTSSLNGVGKIVPGLMSLITDIGYLSFILTFSTNFFIFYKFNAKFSEALVFFSKSK